MVIPLLLQRRLNLGGEFESLGHGDNLLSKPQFVAAFSILAELGKGVAQWGAGDLYQPFKRMIHFQDHEESDSNRYGASLEPA
jgi:hypothetical protein